MLGDEGTLVFVSGRLSGDQVVDSRGRELLRSKFSDEHKRMTGLLVFVDLEPNMKWPHFCRWIWIDDHGRSREIEHRWPPADSIELDLKK